LHYTLTFTRQAGLKKALQTPSIIPKLEDHFTHCLSYIRQAVKCAGDLTLEKTTHEFNGTQRFGANGWGNVHECRSRDAILAFSEEHRRSLKGYKELKDESH
jgi:hypothetical protein